MVTEFILNIPSEHPCYEDHFPTKTIVPGALLLHWIIQAINSEIVMSTYKPATDEFYFKTFKFTAPVFPQDRCTLIVKNLRGSLSLQCFRAGELIGSGKLSTAVTL